MRLIAEETGCDISLNKLTIESSVSGYLNGVPFICSYTPQGRSSPPKLTVTLPMRVNWKLSARRKKWFDRLCLAIGLARDFATPDEYFNRKVFIDTGDADSTQTALSRSWFRERLLKLLEQRVSQVRFEQAGASLIIRLEPDEIVPAPMVSAALDWLDQLARFHYGVPGSTVGPAVDSGALRFRLAAPLVVCLVVGIVFLAVGTELYPPLYASFWDMSALALPYGLGLAAVYGLCSLLLTRRRTDRHLMTGLALALGLPAFFFLTVGSLYSANGFLDDTPEKQIRATVAKSFIKGRGSRKVRFDTGSRLTADLDRPRDCCPLGDPAVLTTREGRLGVAWVSRWEILAAEKSP
ncbi:MAG: hypothetical protein KQI78_14625 [Deltaproteobacteria bacterium]|nr:hypothetical protein [Deltaproteobacteria bacterium]